jgi:hypothetical protein
VALMTWLCQASRGTCRRLREHTLDILAHLGLVYRARLSSQWAGDVIRYRGLLPRERVHLEDEVLHLSSSRGCVDQINILKESSLGMLYTIFACYISTAVPKQYIPSSAGARLTG